MTLDQLRIFLAVAERGHVTRAAKALNMTQSAVSASISALERRYGTPLFDRIGRRVALTELGRRFVGEARAVLDRAAAARAVLEDVSALHSGSLSIAASQTIAAYWLPRRLTAFHAAHPGIRLDVTIGNTRQVEAAIADGGADLGLVEGETQHPALDRVAADRDRLLLVTSAGHPDLARHEDGRLDLAAISWVVREPGSGTREVFEQVARADGFDPQGLRVFMVLPSNEAVREAVEAGAGATIISEHVVARDIAAGLLKAVDVPLPSREFALVSHRERYKSAAHRAVAEALLAGANA